MSRRCAASVTILALALAGAPAPARAQEPAPPAAYDTVVLRDGGVLRGTILELRPEREVVIAVVGGTRTIAWGDIASTVFAGAAPPAGLEGQVQVAGAAPPTGPEGQVSVAGAAPSTGPGEHVASDISPAADEDSPGPSRPRIFIELTRPADVHLFEAAGPLAGPMGRSAWLGGSRLVCRAPCGKVIDGSAGYPFYFGGDRMLPSRPFFLKDLEGEYIARVRPGRRGLMIGGALMAGFGYAGTLTGGMLVGIARESELQPIGGAVLGVGLALLVAGITLAVHGVTRVRLEQRL